MALTLSDEARKQALRSIERFCTAELEIEASQIQATALLDYFLKEIAPTVYNAGIADAQAYFHDRVADLEGVCHEPEFAYWPKGSSVRRK